MRKSLILLVVALCSKGGWAQTKPVMLATYTYATNNRLKNLEPLAEYLTTTTGLTVKAKSYPTVSALVDAIRHDSVDIAMMNTSGYLALQRNQPGTVMPLVNLDMGSGPVTAYGGCLITRRETGITTLKQLVKRDKRYVLSLVNASSTSGNLVPRLLLNAQGITDPEAVMDVRYAGTHRKVVEAVLGGSADLGGCGCAEVDSARKYLAFNEHALVVESFDDIPLGPIVVKKKMPQEVQRVLRARLLSLHQEDAAVFVNFCAGWTEFRGAKRFKEVADNEYNPFRKMFGSNVALWKLIE